MALPACRYDHCLVTGASAGIGRAFAEALAGRARRLTLVARRAERLEALARRLEERGPVRCRVVALDLAAPGAGSDLAARIAAEGEPVDLLVNNAGFGKHGDWDEFDWDDWSRLFQLNMVTAAELLHRLWPDLVAVPGRGAINVASTAAFQPLPGFAAYAASKAFLRSLSAGLAIEARRRGARVLGVCPGPTETEFGEVAEADWGEGKPTMSPVRVVAIALAAYESGRVEVIPGIPNRALAVLSSRLPLRLVLPLAARVVRRRSPRPRPGAPVPR